MMKTTGKKKMKKEKTPNTLLGKFIFARAEKYREPVRKRTLRGSVIGFSFKKYLASLLMITSLEVRNRCPSGRCFTRNVEELEYRGAV
jgi:hypothetical protein